MHTVVAASDRIGQRLHAAVELLEPVPALQQVGDGLLGAVLQPRLQFGDRGPKRRPPIEVPHPANVPRRLRGWFVGIPRPVGIEILGFVSHHSLPLAARGFALPPLAASLAWPVASAKPRAAETRPSFSNVEANIVAEILLPEVGRAGQRAQPADQLDQGLDLLLRLGGRDGLVEDGLRDELVLERGEQVSEARGVEAVAGLVRCRFAGRFLLDEKQIDQFPAQFDRRADGKLVAHADEAGAEIEEVVVAVPVPGFFLIEAIGDDFMALMHLFVELERELVGGDQAARP